MMRRSRQTPAKKAFPAVGMPFAERYQLEAMLGSGSGSVVFKALDSRLNRPVALKVLTPDEMDTAGLERFRREALSIARLSHPGIVTIYDFSEADGLPYLVLELVAGVDLWQLVYGQQTRLSIADCLKISMSILEALDYAHTQGVVHRDLKPENVMVDHAYNTKVTDFGLAYIRGQNRITKDGTRAGTAYYIAPEVADGKASDHRADLYALGCILYELLAGRLPFYSENPLAVISQHLYDAPLPPSDHNAAISPILDAIVLKLLAKRPEDRFQSAGAVLNALKNLDQETPLALTQHHLLDRITRAKPPGRETEWKHLRDCWQQTQLGSPNARPVVMIAGEAGSGKNELAHQLLAEARMSGGVAYNSQCFVTSTPLPYQPIIEILRDYLRDHHPAVNAQMAADLAKLVPEISDDYPLEPLPSLPPEAEQLRLYEHLTQFFIQISQQQPIVLMIEYAHCTDPSSMSLLHYLARHMRGYPILILGTYRPSELDHNHPLEMLLRELTSQNLLERITLHLMEADEVRRFIESIFGVGIPAALCQAVYNKTQGNLFFVKEILKSLVSEGLLVWDDVQGRWHANAIDMIELPSSIRSIIGHSLSKLSQAALESLSVAAVIGREFTLRVLAHVSDLDEDSLADALEEALQARLLTEKRGGREEIYSFENLVIHQTLLERLNLRRTARLHLKVAKSLETLYRHQLDDHIETIARHYSLGARTDEDISTAIGYLERAADRASRIFALANAVDLYTQALDLTQDDQSPLRDERLLALRKRRGAVYQQIGDFAAAATDLEAVLGSPQVSQNATHKRAVLLQLGQVYRRMERFEDAIRALTDAVEISRMMQDESLVADALYYLGATYWSLGEINQALVHQEEGYAIVQRLGLQDEIAMRVLHGIAECYGRKVDYARMFALAEESLRMARALGDMEYQSENLMIMGTAEIERGYYEHALEIFAENAAVCQQAGLRWHHTSNLTVQGRATAAVGDYERGMTLLLEGAATAKQHFKGFLVTMVHIYLGVTYLELEQLDLAEAALSVGLERAQRHRISWSDAGNKAYWSLVQIRRGNLEVGALLEESLALTLAKGDMRHVPLLYRSLAELELQRQNPEMALRWAEKMHMQATEFDQPILIIRADLLRARAFLALQAHETALELLENALEDSVAIRSPRLAWEMHRSLAEAYDHNHKPAEAEKCRLRVHGILQNLSQNISDRALRQHLHSLQPPPSMAGSLTTTLRLLVITDAFGTVVREAIQAHMDAISRCDALVLLGDLPAQAYPTLRNELGLTMRGLCVLGNHDHESWRGWLPRYNFEYVHGKAAAVRIGGQDITFAGFSGSEAYKANNSLHWDDVEAARTLKDLPPCDILISHTAPAPPPEYPEDRNHRGLTPLGDYIRQHQPKVALHGHFHKNYQVTLGKTRVIGCYGAVLVQCMISDEKWQIEIQPLLDFA